MSVKFGISVEVSDLCTTLVIWHDPRSNSRSRELQRWKHLHLNSQSISSICSGSW